MADVAVFDSGTAWRLLGTVSSSRRQEARRQLHWAAQVVSALGKTHVTPRPDDSHPSFGWDAASAALVGHATETTPSFCGALFVPGLELQLRDATGKIASRLPLSGARFDEAFAWFERELAHHSGGDIAKPLDRNLYEIPQHPVRDGAPFAADRDALTEMAAWFHVGDLAIGELIASIPGASPIRCWPHHFDIGTLVLLEAGSDPEDTRSIGIGMTPGDEYYGDPYWYVNPFPAAETAERPPLRGGHWHDRDWFGAVMSLDDLLTNPRAEFPTAMDTFLNSAVRSGRAIAGVQ